MFEPQVLGGILGFVTADALGVPVEFESRSALKAAPVVDVRAFGSYCQPAGTWSDDSTMTLCTLESLTEYGLDYEDMMERFLAWADEGYMTPYGEVFDMGRTTLGAIVRYAQRTPPLECGAARENENGNGSLMRILPIAFWLHRFFRPCFSEVSTAYEIIHKVSSLTHAHPISLISCGIYCAVAGELLRGKALDQAVELGAAHAKKHYSAVPEYASWLSRFDRVDKNILQSLDEDDIQSSGYVLHTLEAALWCLLTTNSYKECVLKAVNLGSDTDTVAAVAGGLAGIYYGKDAIPREWLDVIARKDMIESLCIEFATGFSAEADAKAQKHTKKEPIPG